MIKRALAKYRRDFIKFALRRRVLLTTGLFVALPVSFFEQPVADAVSACMLLAMTVLALQILRRDSLLEAYLAFCKAYIVFGLRNFYLLIIPSVCLGLMGVWYLSMSFDLIAHIWFLRIINEPRSSRSPNLLRMDIKRVGVR